MTSDIVFCLPMSDSNLSTLFGRALTALIIVIGIVLIANAFFIQNTAEDFAPEPDLACEGEPITVDYTFHGGMLQPHACKPQCNTDTQRYVLYKNGKATQCQKLPGCLDWGEDRGVTCIPQK